ncbi:uncharacterized protein EHS24_000590 [Apiotrichum porosum]|uniref:DUF2237 domain-containing protein n=1 Tax=Apiotrichum porosum TaxID=105984 RepID=A0A427YAC6_9TREE|nr:uncharacterized protein EHS24_000590 [Apiotrichum porosum]RSH88063.1 hypothetical protein EHS24_000590 [Apiotrichum porosum]
MVIETSKLSVLHGPLQPNTRPGDRSHPTGFYRDGYCWGEEEDFGQHYVAGIMTKEFLEFSKRRGNDLSSRRPGFQGLTEGCRWCLCVERWKEAMMASERLGERVVPRVDLAATAMDTLRSINLEDLRRFAWRGNDVEQRREREEPAPESPPGRSGGPGRSGFGGGSSGSGPRRVL